MDLSRISAALEGSSETADLPVENWSPSHCGEMDLVIRADGTWIHEGSPIGRPGLVRLLSRILRQDAQGFVLVTPVEKLSISVEDVPFLVVDFDRIGKVLRIRSNVGDVADIGPEHPLEIRLPANGEETMLPYVCIRGKLWARFSRSAYYRLIDQESWESDDRLFVTSAGYDFELGTLT